VIGAHLAEQLATERHEVALFDVATKEKGLLHSSNRSAAILLKEMTWISCLPTQT